jgi:hypothetical protein
MAAPCKNAKQQRKISVKNPSNPYPTSASSYKNKSYLQKIAYEAQASGADVGAGAGSVGALNKAASLRLDLMLAERLPRTGATLGATSHAAGWALSSAALGS